MALEDYRIDNNTVMCWDPDGRLNTNVWPYNLKNTTVATLLPQLENLALIKGLVLNGDDWRQYVKIEDALYEMSEEVKKYRTKLKTIKPISNPELSALKKYLKDEGFEYNRSDGVYYAPTNKLEANDMESFGLPENARHWSTWSIYESFYVTIYISEKSFESCIYREPWNWDLDNNVSFSWPQREKKETRYEASLEALEKFKQEWTSFKEAFPERLEKAKQELKAKTEELKNAKPVEEAIQKVKADGYVKAKDGYGGDLYRKVLANGTRNKLIAEIQIRNSLEAENDWKALASGDIYIAAGLSSSNQKASMYSDGFRVDWSGQGEEKSLKKEFDFNVLNILSQEASKALYEDRSVDQIIKVIDDFAQAYNNSKETVSIE